MSEVKIPEGYKQTEAGLIPSDWKLLTIVDVASFSGGSQPPRSTFIFSPRPSYIRLIQIRDYKTSNFETYIPEHLANKKCEKTDIMIGRYGPPIFQILRGIEGAYNVALIKVTPSNDIQREYLYYFLKTEKLFQLMELLSRRSSGQTGVELPALKAYPIPLPPKSEQTAIATALSDVDNLIGSLEKLIAKKEAIKAGTMQQLLTGKTRLPEFATHDDGSPKGFKQSELGRIPEDWEVKAIAKIVKDSRIPSGLYKDKNSYATGAGTSIIKLGDVFSSNIFDPKSAQRVNVDKSEIERYKVEIGDLIIALASVKLEGVGKVMHVTTLEEETIYDHNVALIRTINNVSSSFLSDTFHSNYFRSLVASKATQVGTTFLKASTILGFELHLPSIKEQNAIATVLSDMDTEIQVLQQRLEKTKDIKQGMMQQLLTGKVRLVDSSAKSDTQTLASKGELQA